MTKRTKQILIGLAVLTAAVFSFIIYGLYLMTIEDRYGDLQQIYFDSESGDVIINNLNGQTGILEFEGRQVFVNTGKDVQHVDEWLDPLHKYIFNADIYHPEEKSSGFIGMDKNALEQKIRSGKLRPVLHVEFQ